ncbi:MAG TPA: argininosuccinate synthase, partial [Magnetospirillaceae bacterium]|nr:argininosuccinate synthase [Magnetospirillaceae bacterium]
MHKKMVLAFSGGLDTTAIVPWLKENFDCQVVAFCGDVGQAFDRADLERRALAAGAARLVVKDLKDEFVESFLWPVVRAGAAYEGRYLLGSAASRPLLARSLAETALEEGADAVVHGCTGKGNDQVRFELGIRSTAPDLEIIAPWRIWDIASREEAIAYLEARGIPVPVRREDLYSRDQNLWHASHEGMDLEDPADEPDWTRTLKLCSTPENAPSVPEYIELGFERGVPVALNGVRMGGVELISALNTAAGRHGVGILDMVENRVVGMKGRGVYETPGGTVIMESHARLEQLCLDKKTLSFKLAVAQRFAELLYEGEWFSPLMEALRAFV